MIGDLLKHFIERLEESQDELVIVLTSHLLTEFIINRIIEERCQESKKILSDHRSYTYAVKLTIINCMGMIPEYLFHNLTKLNGLRNEFSHNLRLNPKKLNLSFRNPPLLGVHDEIVYECSDDSAALFEFIYAMCSSVMTNFAAHASNELEINLSLKSLPH